MGPRSGSGRFRRFPQEQEADFPDRRHAFPQYGHPRSCRVGDRCSTRHPARNNRGPLARSPPRPVDIHHRDLCHDDSGVRERHGPGAGCQRLARMAPRNRGHPARRAAGRVPGGHHPADRRPGPRHDGAHIAHGAHLRGRRDGKRLHPDGTTQGRSLSADGVQARVAERPVADHQSRRLDGCMAARRHGRHRGGVQLSRPRSIDGPVHILP